MEKQHKDIEIDSKDALKNADTHPEANVQTDPQDKMEGPISSIVQEIGDTLTPEKNVDDADDAEQA